MDFRDFLFWRRQAQLKALEREKQMFLAARYAQVSDKDFKDKMRVIKNQMISIFEQEEGVS